MATRTVKEIAVDFGTDGRTLRKFLRSEAGLNARVGKGNRWAIEAKDVRKLRKGFDAWMTAKAEKAAEVAEDAVDEVEDEIEDEVLEDAETE